MKTETAKPSEEKRREQNMCGFFHAKRCTQLGQVLLFPWSFGPLCFPTTESVTTCRGERKLPPWERAPSFTVFAVREQNRRARQPMHAARDRLLLSPRRRRDAVERLNRNPDLPSPRLPGTVPSQLAKFGDIQNMKVKNLNFLETWRETDGQVCFSSLIS